MGYRAGQKDVGPKLGEGQWHSIHRLFLPHPHTPFMTLPCSVMQAWDCSGAVHPQNSVASGSHEILTMEDVLSLLKSYTEPWLSFSSEYLDAVPSFILLNVVGLLLLLLFYLLLPTKVGKQGEAPGEMLCCCCFLFLVSRVHRTVVGSEMA